MIAVVIVAGFVTALAGTFRLAWLLGYREAERRYVKASRHPTVQYVRWDENR